MALLERLRFVKSIKPTTAEMSDMALPESHRRVRRVKPAIGEMSDMALLERLRDVRRVKPDTAEMSDMELLSRSRDVRLVKRVTTDISDMALSSRSRDVRLVKPASGERSDTELLFPQKPVSSYPRPRSRLVSCVACSNPVKSLMLALGAPRRRNLAISAVVMVAPDAVPRASSIAARRLESGMLTASTGGSVVPPGVTDSISQVPSLSDKVTTYAINSPPEGYPGPSGNEQIASTTIR